jgi:alpha/beta superfamily hydrolase
VNPYFQRYFFFLDFRKGKAYRMKEIFLKTEDNIKIAINHYDSGRDTVVIIAHGWYMCKDSKVFKALSEDFYKNFDVITMDFRGHGRSSGFYTFSAKEVNDLKAVVDYAKSRYSRVNLLGFSLGAATSIIHTAKYKDIDSLIVVSPPVSFDKIENHFFKKEAYIPTIEKFELWRSLSIRAGNPFLPKINPIDVIQDISPIPVLFLAGEIDPTVYAWHAKKLYNKACQPKSIMIFQDNYHAEDLYLSSRDKFLKVCNSWFDIRGTINNEEFESSCCS